MLDAVGGDAVATHVHQKDADGAIPENVLDLVGKIIKMNNFDLHVGMEFVEIFFAILRKTTITVWIPQHSLVLAINLRIYDFYFYLV